MRIEHELDKTLHKISRRVYKEAKLPSLIGQFVSITVDSKSLKLIVYYNGEYVTSLSLCDDYKYYYTTEYLAKELKDILFHYASKVELKRNEDRL